MRRSEDLFSLPESLKPYLSYSLALHGVAAVLLIKMLQGVSSKSSPIYTIDFVGPAATIVTSGAQAPPPPQETTAPATRGLAPQSVFDEFGRRRRRKPFVLPRPSLLLGFRQKAKPQAEAPASAAPAAVPSAEPSGPPGEAGVATDMPNFPYPWYISQVRASLWNQWAAHMPKQSGECVVVFSIIPDGNVVDLRTETSSGDSAFDLTALSAVQDASPYPPLPKGFAEPFLKVHVTLKTL